MSNSYEKTPSKSIPSLQTISNTQETSATKTNTMLSGPRMELLNNYIDEDSEMLSYRMKLGWMERNKCLWESFISNTQPRFNVILEIFKNQEKRIQELEKKINSMDKPQSHPCNIGFLDE
jgi:hypothetical protein